MPRMVGQRIVGPTGPPLLKPSGRGGPISSGDIVPLTARPPQKPPNVKPFPPIPTPSLPNPLAGISGAIGTAGKDIVAAGSVVLGVVLVAIGLLLASGQMGRVARGASSVTPVGRAVRTIRPRR